MNPLKPNKDVVGRLTDISHADFPEVLTMCVEASDELLVLDLRNCQSVSDAFAVLAQRLAFSEHFGGNLDALFDVVNERVFGEADVGLKQTWLIKSSQSQGFLLPIRDTLADAMGEEISAHLTVLWLTL